MKFEPGPAGAAKNYIISSVAMFFGEGYNDPP